MDQNYCPQCGQPDNCGDCNHSPNTYNPQDPLTAAAVIGRLNGEIADLKEIIKAKDIRIDSLESSNNILRGTIRDARTALSAN